MDVVDIVGSATGCAIGAAREGVLPIFDEKFLADLNFTCRKNQFSTKIVDIVEADVRLVERSGSRHLNLGVLAHDADIGIVWPGRDTPILSEKDQNWPALRALGIEL